MTLGAGCQSVRPPKSILSGALSGQTASLAGDAERDFTTAWQRCAPPPPTPNLAPGTPAAPDVSASVVTAAAAANSDAADASRQAAAAAKSAAEVSAGMAANQASLAHTAQQQADAAAYAAATSASRARSSPDDTAAQSLAARLAQQATQAASAASAAVNQAAAASSQAAQDAAIAARAAQDAARASGTNVTAAQIAATTLCDPQGLLNKGVTVINNRCEQFFERLGKASQDFNFGLQQWGLIGGTAGAIEGLAGVAAKPIAITASGFGFGTASLNAYQQAYLFSADVGSVQSMVTSGQKSALSAISTAIQQQGGTSGMTRDDVLQVLKQYERSCEVQTIHALVNQSVKTAKPETTSAPQIANPTPPPFVINHAASFAVTATGAPAPIFSLGACAPWLQISADSGIVSGTAPAGTVPGPQPCAINAKNGVQPDASKTVTLNVTAAPIAGGSPVFTTADAIEAVVGTPVSHHVATTSQSTFHLADGRCSSWLSFDSSWNLTGTPKAIDVGTYTCDVETTGANPITQTLEVIVAEQQPFQIELNYNVE